MRALLFVLVLLPLWTSYLVRIYAWRLILAKDGALNWALNGIGLPDAGLAYTNKAMWIVFSYVWLPFMVLPVYAALERIPAELPRGLAPTSAARGWRTFRTRDPARWRCRASSPARSSPSPSRSATSSRRCSSAGPTRSSSATWSTTSVGVSGNMPFAAAFATVPVIVMAVYLVIAKRLGAFEAL